MAVVEYAEQLRAEVRRLEMQRVKLQAELARIDGHLSGLQHALSLFLGEGAPRPVSRHLDGASEARSRVPDPTRSPGWAFVMDLLSRAPASGFSVEDIARQAEDAGQQISRNTLRANLSNAASEHVVERVSTGRYRLPSSDVASFEDMQTEQTSNEASAQEDETPGEDESPGVSTRSTPELARLLA